MPVASVLHTDAVTARVNRFYEELPFNVHGRPDDTAAAIRAGNPIARAYPGLDMLLRRHRGQRVLDAGCGGGWWSNAVAWHYDADVTGVDLCSRALAHAQEVAGALAAPTPPRFVRADLLQLDPHEVPLSPPFHIVNSLGVLHHTADCRRGLESILSRVAPRGFIHLGLYHLYGRRPFLNLFADIRARLEDDRTTPAWRRLEDEAFARYRALSPAEVTDPVLLRSWFRDQVLHPHETQHTVEETCGWLDVAGFECLSTSVTDFAPVTDWAAVFARERTLEDLSYQQNVVQGRYYPGFFVVLARRR